MPNGPYIVEGDVDVFDTAEEGNKPEATSALVAAGFIESFLRWCHSAIGVQAAETVNPASAE